MRTTDGPEAARASRGWIYVILVIVLLAGLPLAVWFDLRSVTEVALMRQVTDLNAVLGGVRDFYSTDVVGRVLSGHTTTLVTNDFENHPGAIPFRRRSHSNWEASLVSIRTTSPTGSSRIIRSSTARRTNSMISSAPR